MKKVKFCLQQSFLFKMGSASVGKFQTWKVNFKISRTYNFLQCAFRSQLVHFHQQVLEWLVSLVEGSDIEEVTDDMLEKMIITEDKLAVLFYEENDEVSATILESMENIDDDLVRNRINWKASFHGLSKYRFCLKFNPIPKDNVIVFQICLSSRYDNFVFRVPFKFSHFRLGPR